MSAFSGTIEAKVLKLGLYWDNEYSCNVGLRIGPIALILPFIYSLFCLSKVNLCHSFFFRKSACYSLLIWHTWRMSDCIV